MIVLALLLVGCAQQNYESEYCNMTCEELSLEYKNILLQQVDHFNARMKYDDVKLAVGAVAGAITKMGNTPLSTQSFAEEDCDKRLDAIRKTMKQLNCTACKGCKK